MGDNAEPLKVVLVGDGAVGKTCLLIARTKNEFPKRYVPTVFENTTTSIDVNGESVKVDLWDTAGQEDFDRLRPLSYPKTNIFLICFSVTQPDSLANVKSKWHPEVNHHCPGVPWILVGTKVDLRDNEQQVRELSAKGMVPISTQQGRECARQLGAVKYIECSALTRTNVGLVFDEAVLAVTDTQNESRRQRKTCVIV
ncbi:MAG: hypothetical protein MHM6MM_006888 [Cercozoa sp. M6MM]